MKTAVKRVLTDQRGGAFILTLVLLLVGSLVIPSLLEFMFGGLAQADIYQRRGAELYAADAGVEDALWRIQQRDIPVCPSVPYHHYDLEDPVNGRSIGIDITYGSDVDGFSYYQITSTANGDGSATTVDAYAVNVYGNYTDITNNVLTSQEGISYPPKPIVNYPEGNEPQEYYQGPWPDLATLAAWYKNDVKGLPSYPSDTIDLDGEDRTLGPLYREGALTITNTGKKDATLTLTGTLYVTGDLVFANTDTIIDLNNHAVFVESQSTNPPKHALYVSGKCTMRGPGVLAAMGDIYFEPNIEAGMTDPIFIISVYGTTTLKPGGDFYGAVAGSVEVYLQPGSTVSYPEDGFPDDLNWPGFTSGKYTYAVRSWTISTS